MSTPRRWLHVTSFVVAAVGAAMALLRARRTLFTVEVAGESMTPALAPGDYLLVRRQTPARPLAMLTGQRARGQIVAARGPEGRLLVKRIVGLPGESLRVGEAVQVNGQPLVEPYTHGSTPEGQYRGVHRLGPDEYFLIGDHRAASTDSRDFGPVAAAAVEGVVWLRYWPVSRFGAVGSSLATDAMAGQPQGLP